MLRFVSDCNVSVQNMELYGGNTHVYGGLYCSRAARCWKRLPLLYLTLTIAHARIAMTMVKQYIVQPWFVV